MTPITTPLVSDILQGSLSMNFCIRKTVIKQITAKNKLVKVRDAKRIPRIPRIRGIPTSEPDKIVEMVEMIVGDASNKISHT